MKAILKENGTVKIKCSNGWTTVSLRDWTSGGMIIDIHPSITEVVIEKGVTVIPCEVFERCYNLSEVIFTDYENVKFTGCSFFTFPLNCRILDKDENELELKGNSLVPKTDIDKSINL